MNPSKVNFTEQDENDWWRISRLALVALVLTGVAAAQDTPAKPHAFFDRTNLALFSADALTRTLDAESTRANLANPCQCFKEDDLPPSIAQSTPRMYAYSLSIPAAILGASYLAHRRGFHRIERLLPMLDISFDARYVGNNYAIRNNITHH